MAIITEELWGELIETYRQNPVEGYARLLHYFVMNGFDTLSDDLDALFGKDKEQASAMMVGVYSEFLALYLHLTNRNAEAQFGRDNTSKIQSSLAPYIVENAKAYYTGDTDQVRTTIFSIANDAENTYAACKYWINPNETNSMKAYSDNKATFVQFLRRLSKPLKRDYDNLLDKIYIDGIGVAGTQFFFSMVNMDEWLKGVAMHLNIAKFDEIDLSVPNNGKK